MSRSAARPSGHPSRPRPVTARTEGSAGWTPWRSRALAGTCAVLACTALAVLVAPASYAASPTAPVAHDVDAGSVDASSEPTTLHVTPPRPVGEGPFTAALAEGPDAALGTVSVDPATGTLALTPVPGASGVLEATYRVTDGAGRTSDPASVTLDVLPVAQPLVASGEAAQDLDLLVPAPTGTPQGWTTELEAVPPATRAEVSAGDQALRVVTPESTSGLVAATYRVVTADGLASRPAPVRVDVVPASTTTPVVDGTTDGTSAPVGEALQAETDALTPVLLEPVVDGTGPFTVLADAPAGGGVSALRDGTLEVDPQGRSGRLELSYEVVDALGRTSGPVPVTVDVAPVLGEVTAVAAAGTPVTVPLPTPTGTGPFDLELPDEPDPSAVGAAVEVVGDALVVDPDDGAAGTVSVSWTATDDGGTSAPGTVLVHVLPTEPEVVEAPAEPVLPVVRTEPVVPGGAEEGTDGDPAEEGVGLTTTATTTTTGDRSPVPTTSGEAPVADPGPAPTTGGAGPATGTGVTGTQTTGTQSTGTQSTGTQSTGTQSTGTQSTGTQTTGTEVGTAAPADLGGTSLAASAVDLAAPAAPGFVQLDTFVVPGTASTAPLTALPRTGAEPGAVVGAGALLLLGGAALLVGSRRPGAGSGPGRSAAARAAGPQVVLDHELAQPVG